MSSIDVEESRIEQTPEGSAGVVHAAQVRPSLRQSFVALRHRNFRLYFLGLLISVTGTWAQNVAQEWLIYQLTGSPLVLGQVSFVMAVPVWLLSPWAGVAIDRWPRRTLLYITQSVQMLQALTLAALTFTGQIEVWHVFVLSAVRGVANAFDAPARQSFYVELVDDRQDLANAIALNSTLMSTARIVGPSLGGVIIALLGTAWAFTINGATFLAIIVALALMRLPKPVRVVSDKSPLEDMVEGVKFIWGTRLIAGLMAIVLAVALFGGSFRVLLPVVAQEVLGRGEVAFGLLNAGLGVGSLTGALLVTYLATRPALGRVLNLLNIALPIALLAFALSRSFALSLLLIALVGLSQTPHNSISNILVQANIPDVMRGRVMSVYTLVVFGASPLGSYLAGALAEQIGAPLAIAVSAAALLVVGFLTRTLVPEIKAA